MTDGFASPQFTINISICLLTAWSQENTYKFRADPGLFIYHDQKSKTMLVLKTYFFWLNLCFLWDIIEVISSTQLENESQQVGPKYTHISNT